MSTSANQDGPTTEDSTRAPAWLRTCWAAICTRPVTVLALTVLWIVAVATRSLPDGPSGPLASHVLLHLGQIGESPISVIASLIWAPSLGAYVWCSLALVIFGGLSERLLGSRRFAVTLVTTHLAAVAAAIALIGGLERVLPDWAENLRNVTAAGPATGAIGAFFVASAFTPRVWNRRVRVIGLVLLGTLLLYNGHVAALLISLAAVIGLFTGAWLTRHSDIPPNPLGSIHEARTLVALVMAASGVGPLAAAFLGLGAGPFSLFGVFIATPTVLDPAELGGPSCAGETTRQECLLSDILLRPDLGQILITCVPALLLLVLAFGLWRGRRLAFIGTVLAQLTQLVVLVVNIAVNYAAGMSAQETVSTLGAYVVAPVAASVALIAVLWSTRRLFTVTSPPQAVRRFVFGLTVIAAAGLLTYATVGAIVSSQWSPQATWVELAAESWRRLFPLEYTLGWAPAHLPDGPIATFIYSATGIVVWVAVLFVLWRVLHTPRTLGAETQRARQILVRHGGPALAWMGLWEGNEHWFTADGEGYVPYRVISGIALTTGDPICAADEFEQVFDQFDDYARAQGWTPVLYSASERARDVAASRGWSDAKVAEEAVLHLPDLAFTGKRFQDVRTGLNQRTKAGLVTEWTTWQDMSRTARLAVIALSEEWVADQGLPEMGFTLGGIDELEDPAVRIMLLREPGGRLHGAASWLPVYSAGGQITGWVLDFMRRGHTEFKYPMEVLIGQAALDFKEQGYELLSLSGAPLANTSPDDDDPGVVDRVLEIVGGQLEPVYGFRSLLRFKAKFQPTYLPMYLVYPDPAALPAIATAVTKAYVPEASFGTAVTVVQALRRAKERRRR